MCTKPARQRGLTLIELIIFIIIVGVALAGVLSVLNVTARASADPMIRKQMLTIAESLLEEIEALPFTWCDPDDSAAATASSAGDCTTQEAIGIEGTEARSSATAPLDNVSDYHGLTITTNIGGTAMPSGYSASVSVATDAAFGPTGVQPPASEVLRITVTVTHGSDTLALSGYRTRYAPTTLP